MNSESDRNQSVVVTDMNCERIVELFVEEYVNMRMDHGDKPFDENYRMNLLGMMSKTFVAYAMFMKFNLKETQSAVAHFWKEAESFVKVYEINKSQH